jgi:hypothetical protein
MNSRINQFCGRAQPHCLELGRHFPAVARSIPRVTALESFHSQVPGGVARHQAIEGVGAAGVFIHQCIALGKQTITGVLVDGVRLLIAMAVTQVAPYDQRGIGVLARCATLVSDRRSLLPTTTGTRVKVSSVACKNVSWTSRPCSSRWALSDTSTSGISESSGIAARSSLTSSGGVSNATTSALP